MIYWLFLLGTLAIIFMFVANVVACYQVVNDKKKLKEREWYF